MLNQFSIGKRLTLAFLLAAAITLVSGLSGIMFASRVGNAGIYVGESAAPLVDAVMEAKLLATTAHLRFEELMGGDTAESIDNVRALMKEARWYIAVIGEGGANEEGKFIPTDNPATLALVKASLAKFDALDTALANRHATLGKALSPEEFHRLDAAFDSSFDAFIGQIDELESAIQADIKGAIAGLHDTVDNTRMVMAALVFAALLLGVALGRVATASITRPLRECVDLAREIQGGNLAARVTATGRDEIAQLVAALDGMRGGLLDMIGAMRRDIETLNHSAGALAEAAGRSEQASMAQSDAASSMAASIEELSVSIDQIGEHARTANAMAEESGARSQESGRIIHEAAGEMTQIAAAVNGTAGTIRELDEVSTQISGIVNVIKEIADQTNLLALNAAIEAARAGEQGRGFAVVADEVRKLAERTSTSTQEIGAMIERIQHGTRRATEEMETGVRQVDGGVALARRAGDSVTDIRAGAQQVTQVVGEITATLTEQSSTTREIAQRVEQIAQGAETNRTAVAATAVSARQLADLAHELETMTARFRLA